MNLHVQCVLDFKLKFFLNQKYFRLVETLLKDRLLCGWRPILKNYNDCRVPGTRSLTCVRRKKLGVPGTEPGTLHACGDVTIHLAMDTTLVKFKNCDFIDRNTFLQHSIDFC